MSEQNQPGFRSPKDLHKFFLQNHHRAQEFAKEFNAAIDTAGGEEASKVKFVPAYVLKITDEAQTSGFRYVTAERYISGTYVKLNGNDGFVESFQDGEAAKVSVLSNIIFQSCCEPVIRKFVFFCGVHLPE